jgi:uncharacterized Zn finger protein (UPF0148 family)
MKEENIPKITEMLLAGGKMLGIHCAKCMSPLFQFHEKIVCPVCKETVKAAEKAEAKPAYFGRLEEVLRDKLNTLVDELAGEKDHAKILELLDRIKSILEALEKAKKG